MVYSARTVYTLSCLLLLPSFSQGRFQNLSCFFHVNPDAIKGRVLFQSSYLPFVGYIDKKNMGILSAPLCIWLLVANGLSISSGLQDVMYIPLGGSLELPIDGKPTKVLLKTVHSGKEDVVAEWDWGSAEGEVYGKYKNRTELDKETGVTINNMTIEDSGGYYMVFDSVRNSKIYMVEVITATPRNEDEGNTPVGSIVGGIIGALILAVCLVLGVKYRDHIKDRLSSCGSKPMVDPESGVPLQGNKESTPVKNNLDSADGVPLQVKKESTPVKNNLDSADAAATAGASSLKNKNGVIDAILSRATLLYPLCDEVKGNKTQFQRLVQRVKGLEELVLTIKQKGAGQNPADVEKTLSDLNSTLESAEELVQKYTSESFHEHLFKDYESKGIVLQKLNHSLYATFKALSQNLQVEHKVSEETSWQAEDEADREKDHAELKRIMDHIDAILSKATSLYPLCEEVKANKKQFQRLAQRVKGLEELMLTIKQKGAGQNSGDVEKDLSDLNSNLEYAAAFVTNYTSESFHVHLFEDYRSKGIVLQKLNRRLYGPFKVLSQNLQVEHKVSEETSWQAEDEADREKDHAELKRIMDLIDDILPRAKSFCSLCENAKGNKEECQPLKQQVKQLQNLVEEIKQNGAGQNSADVEKALCEVKETLPSAEKIVEQYTDGALKHMGPGSKEKLKKCEEPLSETFNVLSQVHQL